MKLGLLVNSQNSLEIISNLKFKATELFKVTKFVQLAIEEINSFNKIKEKKIKEFGEEKTINNKPVFEVKPENKEQFFAEMEELLNQDIELEVPEISLDAFGDIEMSPKEFLSLKWLIKED
tara:strand:+ start:1955 stop:2317 length:363 start_codon:yes stop_codon:yes gene_type:complete